MASGRTDRDRRTAHRAASGAAALAAVAAMSGCASGSGGEPPCLPPAYSLTPAQARPGETVTVAAPDADCNPRYGKNARIHVSVTDAAGAEVINATAGMNDAGGFSFTFVVPAGAAAGDAAVTAVPDNVDWCDDTGRNNRVAGTAVVLLERTSCVLPVQALAIAP